jgi:adenine-specific DNA-methyltransferase
MEKLSNQTKDLSQENIRKIRDIFPNCVTETVNQSGKPVLSVDFDILRQDLSNHVVEGPKERYQFDWPRKRNAILLANAPTTMTIRPLPEKSVDFETTKNVYIEGDNLEALKILRETYLGKVKMIYIDPPYNTGNDFIYRDGFKKSAKDYLAESGDVDEEGDRMVANGRSNGRFHSDWLNMMYPRLLLSRDLLANHGILMASIGNQEIDNLKKMLDEIFGEECYLGIIAWESKTKCQNTKTAKRQLQNKQEYVLVYSKEAKRYEFNLPIKSERSYPETDEKGKPYRLEQVGEMSASGIRGRSTMIFPILGVMPKDGFQWKIGKENVDTLLERGDLVRQGEKVYFRVRPEDEEAEFAPFWSLYFKDIGTTETAKNYLTSLVGENEFETVKPVEFIEDLLFHVLSENDIVMDYFSGSATTGEALYRLNVSNHSRCRFLLIQLPEKLNSEKNNGFGTLTDLAEYRLKQARKAIKDQSGLLIDPDSDLGFRVYKVDSSNMKDVSATPEDTTLSLLEDQESVIKADRTDLDLVTQVMLQLGITLDAEIKESALKSGAKYYTVNGTDLVCCFSKGINEEDMEELANMKPANVAFRDDSFTDDQDSVNCEQIFKTLSPVTGDNLYVL